ncbi:MAG: cation:proton antiporter [Spirochaetes bacterium]|jgi:NhaP-type Na+/H+ or K+/H+ antiporter|nr:cation:proton antiporter [Spirochaetota bacterium]
MTLQINTILIIILGGGWVFSRIFAKMKLPPVLGMVIFGIICSVTIQPFTHEILWQLAPYLKSFALIVILLRAGLGIQKTVLQKVGATAIAMAFIPCIIEGAALTLLLRHLFGFSWSVSGLTAFMLAAVSPAVVIPSMLELKDRGHSEVPTIIMAGASIDDVFAITLFSVFLGLSTSGDASVSRAIISVPISLILGIVAGTATGLLLGRYFKKHHEKLRATEKTLIILVFATLLVQIGDIYHFAALLGIMSCGFVLLEKHEAIAHELSSKLSKIWIIAEIILFVLIGFSLDVKVAYDAGLKGIALICVGLLFRSFGVFLATMFSGLSFKERLFCMIAYVPKATVQAALGGVALSHGIAEGKTILAIAVIAILFTAPIGLFGIRFFSKRLLGNPAQL